MQSYKWKWKWKRVNTPSKCLLAYQFPYFYYIKSNKMNAHIIANYAGSRLLFTNGRSLWTRRCELANDIVSISVYKFGKKNGIHDLSIIYVYDCTLCGNWQCIGKVLQCYYMVLGWSTRLRHIQFKHSTKCKTWIILLISIPWMTGSPNDILFLLR